VQLATALLGDPEILILDDPTADLDADMAFIVWEYLDSIKRGRTIIMSSMNFELMGKFASRVCILKEG
jgi:ABC-type multidrug transport system ATPase subunit